MEIRYLIKSLLKKLGFEMLASNLGKENKDLLKLLKYVKGTMRKEKKKHKRKKEQKRKESLNAGKRGEGDPNIEEKEYSEEEEEEAYLSSSESESERIGSKIKRKSLLNQSTSSMRRKQKILKENKSKSSFDVDIPENTSVPVIGEQDLKEESKIEENKIMNKMKTQNAEMKKKDKKAQMEEGIDKLFLNDQEMVTHFEENVFLKMKDKLINKMLLRKQKENKNSKIQNDLYIQKETGKLIVNQVLFFLSFFSFIYSVYF
jgi:hypothetical protein